MTVEHPYVSRGGLKLAAALDAFGLNTAGLTCADLGCSTGGFTDCLLQRGANRVFAVDTAYGELAWKLRQDGRVTVLERTNALHADPTPDADHACDLVTIDLGWTPQRLAIPVALRWLRDDPAARIVTLVKPHYERSAVASAAGGGPEGRRARRRGPAPGRVNLTEDEADAETDRVLASLAELGVTVLGRVRSPITGSKGGNVEHLALLAVTDTRRAPTPELSG